MLLNPYLNKPATLPGTRILEATMGLVGTRIIDPNNSRRIWELLSFYAPIANRALGGVRAKLRDQRSFVTFCNQRDLEVLLDLAQPGQFCSWADCIYWGPQDDGWFGLCADDEDLLDDLFERELLLRAQQPSHILLPTENIERRVHLDKNNDVEELFTLIQDFDPETGIYPDPRMETLERRWSRSERKRVRWERS
jgi:hypothetical protein